MPLPNLTAATAIELGPYPRTITQDVNDGGVTNTVWYKHTGQAGDKEIKFHAYGDQIDYFADVRVWTGPVGALVAYLSYNITFIEDIPLQVPVPDGATYYFEIFSGAGDVAAAPLTIEVARGPDLAAVTSDIIINDEHDGYPLVVRDGSTGAVKQFVLGWPNGEYGTMLPSGHSAWEDHFEGTVSVYNGFTFVADQPLAPISSPIQRFIVVSSNRVDRFYLGRENGDLTATIRTMDTTGAFGGTTWTVPTTSAQLAAMTVNLGETILYYAMQGVSAIFRYDLIGNAPLSNLVAAVAGYNVELDLLTMADDVLLVGYRKATAGTPQYIVKRIDLTGAVLNTYNFTFPASAITNLRFAYALDDPTTFWVKRHAGELGNAGLVEYFQVDVATGAILTTFLGAEYQNGVSLHDGYPPVDYDFGNAESCPFMLLPIDIAPPTPPGPPGCPPLFPLAAVNGPPGCPTPGIVEE